MKRFSPGTVLLLLALFLLGACGKKGPIRPLLEDRPAAPENLAARQQGTGMLLSWTPPRTNQNGEPLTDLLGFRIYKMRYDLADACPECLDTSVLLHEIDLDYLRRARHYEGRYYFRDDQIVPGFGYQYRIVPYDRRGETGAPARTRLPSAVPPTPPSEISGSGHDRLVRLAWEPASETRQGIEVAGYNIYRRVEGEPFSPLPINGKPVSETVYEDFGLENDRVYTYGIRTVVRIFDRWVESEISETVSVRPQEGR